MRKTTLLQLALLTAAGGCSRDIIDPDPSTNATVRFVAVEGGCWRLDADNGTRYEPIGLPAEYRVDGRRVRVTVKPRHGAGSFCMVGDLVDIVAISPE